MRGGDKRTGELFSYVDLEKRVRSDHPLRAIRGLVNEAPCIGIRRRDMRPVPISQYPSYSKAKKFHPHHQICSV